MRRILLFFFILLTSAALVRAQNLNAKLLGVWQVNSPKLADAWLANYRFYKDGTFKYSFNQYDDRRRILSASGTYVFRGDSLKLVVLSRKEYVGGDLVAGSMGFQQEELVLEGGKIATIKQLDKTPIVLQLNWLNKKGVIGIKIQNNTYYLISKDPKNQDN